MNSVIIIQNANGKKEKNVLMAILKISKIIFLFNEEFTNLKNPEISDTEHDMSIFQKIKNYLSHVEYILIK